MWKSEFRQNYYRTSFSPTVPPFAARISHVIADRGTWRPKWERLKVGESNGKLPPRTCPRCSVPEPYQSHDWALVPAKPGLQGWILMNECKQRHSEQQYEIWCSRGCVDEDAGLLGCADTSLGEYCLTCQRNVVSSSSKVNRSQKNFLLVFEDGGTTFLWNTENHSCSDTLSYPRQTWILNSKFHCGNSVKTAL